MSSNWWQYEVLSELCTGQIQGLISQQPNLKNAGHPCHVPETSSYFLLPPPSPHARKRTSSVLPAGPHGPHGPCLAASALCFCYLWP